MTDRVVVARLRAENAQYDQAMDKSTGKTRELGAAAQKTAMTGKQAHQELGRNATIAGGAMLLGFGMVTGASMRFEKAMSGVRAKANATSGEMAKLSAAALKAGADTVFSASEAARAEEELAKAGISTADILGGGLTGALSLAAAGQIDLGEAATISAQAMKIFKLAGSDVAHIADVLAAGATKSAADVSDLGMALKQGGLVARQTGLSLEDTTGVLAAFADNALIGSDAGTSLKTMLQRLTPTSAEAQAAMDSLGISAYDAQGNFIGLDRFAGVLRSSMEGLTVEQRNAAMSTIFGSDATRAAAIVYDLGAEGIRDYTRAVNDQGAAQRMAAIQLDNLSGDIEQFTGSVETAFIKSGSAANDMARDVVQGATGIVNAYSNLPGPVQTSATALLGVAGAATLLGGGMLILIPKIHATRTAIKTLGVEMPKTARAAGTLGHALGKLATLTAVAGVLGGIFDAISDAPAGIEATTAAMLRMGDGFQDLDALFAADKLMFEIKDFEGALRTLTAPSLGDQMDNFAGKLLFRGSSEKTREIKEQVDVLGESLAKLVAEGHGDQAARMFDQLAAKAATVGVTADELRKLLPAYDEALFGVANSAQKAGGAHEDAAPKITALEQAAEDAATAVDELKSKFDSLIGVMLNSDAASAAAEASLDDLAAAVKSANESGKEFEFVLDKTTGRLKDNTEARRAASEKTRASIEDILAAAVAMREEGRSVGETSRITRRRIDALLASLNATKLTKAEVERLTRVYHLTPKEVRTLIKASGVADAERAVRSLQARLNEIERTYHVRIAGGPPAGGGRSLKGGITFGEGGMVPGARGRPLVATVHGGEGVVNEQGMDRLGPAGLAALNSGATLTPIAATSHTTTVMRGEKFDYDRLAQAMSRVRVHASIDGDPVARYVNDWMGRN